MNKEKSYKDMQKVIYKIVICIIFMLILFILLHIRIGINSIINYIYFILSFIAGLFLIITYPHLMILDKNFKIKSNLITNITYELSDFFSLFIVLCCLIQAFFAFGYFKAEVEGSSMENTFYGQDIVICRSTSNVKNRDVVVIRYDEDINCEYGINGTILPHCKKCLSNNLKRINSDYYKCLDCYNIQTVNLKTGDLLIKRVIAMSGDYIKKDDHYLYVNDNIVVDCKSITDFNLDNYIGKGLEYDSDTNSYIITLDYYFVMGDNRGNSLDSRKLGLFKKTQIVGCVKYKVNSLFDFEEIKIFTEEEIELNN